MNKEFSLGKKHIFEKIIKTGSRINHKNFSIFYVNSDSFKIGISVPKKLGNAVFRNKNKRQIKNIINKIENLNQIHKSFVLIVRENFVNLDFKEKSKILNELFENLKK